MAVYIYKLLGLFFILVSSLALANCSTFTVYPNTLGIPNAQWNQYSETQRQEIIDNYHLSKKYRKISNGKKGAPIISVSLKGGNALIFPSDIPEPYQPLSFELKEGDCNHKFSLFSQENPKKHAKLIACYKDSILYLDPSPYNFEQPYGSIQFPYMPIWNRGFMYSHVSSGGGVGLSQVDVFVIVKAPGK